MKTAFKDHFSKQAEIYRKYRPHYPTELFAYLSSLCEGHELAWDCGTGNGQSAAMLVDHFDAVIATDPSAEQVKNCFVHDRISYRVETSEQSSLADCSADLLTVASALHWFNFEAFYAEARRVLKPKGIIAAWAYILPVISEDIDKLINDFHYNIVGKYWLPENRLIERGYVDIPFPFEKLSPPAFCCEQLMHASDFAGYLNTWSATQRYIAENNSNPVDLIAAEMKALWGENERPVRWDLILKVGRV